MKILFLLRFPVNSNTYGIRIIPDVTQINNPVSILCFSVTTWLKLNDMLTCLPISIEQFSIDRIYRLILWDHWPAIRQTGALLCRYFPY